MKKANSNGIIAVTGATGYVGGRLVPRLLEAGYNVRCIVRNSEALDDRSWRSEVEVYKADLSVKEQVVDALHDVEKAYYLVHSMAASSNFEDLESSMAQIFSEAADTNEIKQIVFLGGLVEDEKNHSPH